MHVALAPILGALIGIEVGIALVWYKGVPCRVPICLVPNPLECPSRAVGELTVDSHEVSLIECGPRAK